MKNRLRSAAGNLLSIGRRRVGWLLPAALTTSLLAVSQLPAQAQFPINEPFTGPSTSKFTLGGNSATNTATLTGTTNTPGYLRLTTNDANRAGFAILNGSFPAPSGFNISFEFFSYGGTGADGISVFLVDANGTDPTQSGQFSIGAYGGSLGYAQKTAAGGGGADINGVTKGYLGIGIDEFGNYSTSSEGRVGGYSASGANTTTRIPQSVALRGPVGNSQLEGYSFLTGSGTLPFNLSVTTVEAQPGSADYRKAYINVVPVNGTYQITVRIQNGAAVTTAINAFTVNAPPANLRVGFAASTGGSNNYHEIRNLAILQNPFAGDDNAVTRFGVPVTFSLVGNDKGIGAALNYASVDLDPATSGRQTTYTVSGQGTFTLNDNTSDGTQSTVTFTPVAGFAGVVTIPYVISDILGQVSDVANISVRVTGADVATSVSGPASVVPGAQVTYRVATTNIGTETATNVSPTLQLPANLTIPTSSNYTYNSSTGLVTFAATTLAAGASTAGNSITFTVPASGVSSITATSGYSYPTNAVIPDPNAANNGTSLTTNITGAAGTTTSCATPGKDGPGSLSSTSTPNTYYPGVSVATANGVSTITVGAAASAGSSTAVAAGDLVLVMQMQDGANMITATNNTYGTFSTASTAGTYEYATVASVNSATAPTAITLNRTLTNTYVSNAGTSRNFQVVRVPQYSSLTVNGVATGAAWDSQNKTGGVLALDVAGQTNFTGTTPGLSMTGRGFAGGAGVSRAGTTTNDPNVYVTPTSVTAHGTKGEGIGGTPVAFYNGTVGTTGAGYPGGDNNRGTPANGGGGAQDFTPLTNSGNSGGSGGGNYAVGGQGGYGAGSGGTNSNRAVASKSYQLNAKQLLMGGGGGAGSTNGSTANAVQSSGAAGGGIIILRTGTVTGTVATITADGANAPSTAAGTTTQGGGGGGAGGSIMLLATPATGSSTLTTLTASASGGNGGSVNLGANNAPYGPGGGGGGGIVYASSVLQTAPTTAGGSRGSTNSGITTTAAVAFGASNGSTTTASSTSTSPDTDTNTTGGANACLPVLSVALSTTTPSIARASSSSTPGRAAYTATISNVGSTVSNAIAYVLMDTQFTYGSTTSVTLTTAAGITTTLVAGTDYALSTTAINASSPVFFGLTIPSGATLRLNFSANIAANSVNGYVYQASAGIQFTDPTRTAPGNAATPGGPFASGGGTVPGNTYAAASSTAEDVTLVNPLPVELIRFEVQAVRRTALLTWTTATEHNNDHFTVERSLDGRSFTAIGTLLGQGTKLMPTSYTFTDAEAGHLATGPVYYRLRQVDSDGESAFSPVRTVQFEAQAAAPLSLYPNPSPGQTLLDLRSLPVGTYAVQVFDLAGRLLRTQAASAQQTSLDLAGLPQGAYLVLVQGENFRQSLPLLRN